MSIVNFLLGLHKGLTAPSDGTSLKPLSEHPEEHQVEMRSPSLFLSSVGIETIHFPMLFGFSIQNVQSF